MAKKNKKYWIKRFEQLEEAVQSNAETYKDEVEDLFQEALTSVEKDIAYWYNRYATTKGMSYTDAKKELTAGELKELQMSLDEYIAKGESLDPVWVRQLEAASTRAHLNRLEALELQMQQHVELLTSKLAQGSYDTMSKAYTDSFYQSMYEIQKGFNVGFTVRSLDVQSIDKILSNPWTADGINFSERIWGKYRPQLVNSLHKGLINNLANGYDPQKLINQLSKNFKVTKNQAGNLVMTESAFFASVGRKDCFNDLDVEEYEIVATLDSATSETCQDMDGKTFPMSDYEIGTTAPPFHNRCRSTTVPKFDDEFGPSMRAARGEDGKTYYVPADTKYEDWKEKALKQFKDSTRNLGLADPQYDISLTDFEYSKEKQDNLDNVYSELLDLYSKDGYEHLALVDSTSGLPITPIVNGDEEGVAMSQEMYNLLKYAKANSLTFIHNHPNGSSFSADDLYIALKYDSIKEIIVINDYGEKYFFSAGNRARMEIGVNQISILDKNILNGMDKILEQNEDISRVDAYHLAIKILCDLGGWVYGRKR